MVEPKECGMDFWRGILERFSCPFCVNTREEKMRTITSTKLICVMLIMVQRFENFCLLDREVAKNSQFWLSQMGSSRTGRYQERMIDFTLLAECLISGNNDRFILFALYSSITMSNYRLYTAKIY